MRKKIIVLLIFALLIGLCGCGDSTEQETASSATTSASTTTSTTANTTPSTTTTPPTQQPDEQERVLNIALFGIDQESGSVGRSDTIMVLSIDYENSHIKLASIARDTLVPIAGHGEEKLTHAWAYGGLDLAMSTLNDAFGMNLSDYVYVNFADFVTIIDQIGGVEIAINEVELNFINYTTNEAAKLPGVGVHRLNGEQALRYVRCRTDSDANRTARQRILVQAVLDEVWNLSPLQATKIISTIQDMCHTNLSNIETTKFIALLTLQDPTWEELSLPDARLNPWSGILDAARGWVYVYDLEYASALLHDFIYDEDTASALPKPTKPQPN